MIPCIDSSMDWGLLFGGSLIHFYLIIFNTFGFTIKRNISSLTLRLIFIILFQAVFYICFFVALI